MKKFWKWRIIYGICCLIYFGWVINVGTNEFNRINRQYRQVAAQLDDGRIRTAALEELIAECRRESAMRVDLQEDACFTWPVTAVEAREKKIKERLIRARERAGIKLILFYTSFVAIFLIAPALFIYLLIVGALALFSKIKIVR